LGQGIVNSESFGSGHGSGQVFKKSPIHNSLGAWFSNIGNLLSINERQIVNRLPSYGLIPAISLELLFRLAGIHVPAQIIAGMTFFLILRFSGLKNI
jgi:hypothetical protein